MLNCPKSEPCPYYFPALNVSTSITSHDLWLHVVVICLGFSCFEIQMQLTKFVPISLMPIPNSSSGAFVQAQNAPNPFSAGVLLRKLTRRSPSPPSRLGRGIRSPIPFPLDIFGALNSVPIFCQRFMVTLLYLSKHWPCIGFR